MNLSTENSWTFYFGNGTSYSCVPEETLVVISQEVDTYGDTAGVIWIWITELGNSSKMVLVVLSKD